ncbi:MAG: hypothetical protein AB7H92_15530 [Microbacteriaceae bacterium]
MKYRIDGVEYAFDDLGSIPIQESRVMAAQGLGVYRWPIAMGEIARLSLDEGGDVVVLSEREAAAHPERCNPALFMESERHLLAFTIFLWLCQRRTDPKQTFEATQRLTWDLIEPVDDDDDEPDVEGDEDPTQPPASAQGTGGGAAATSAPSKGSRTRKRT